MNLEDLLEAKQLFEPNLNRQFFNKAMELVSKTNGFLDYSQYEYLSQHKEEYYDVDEQLTNCSEYKCIYRIIRFLRESWLGDFILEFEGEFPDIRIGKTYLRIGQEYFASVLINREWMTVSKISKENED